MLLLEREQNWIESLNKREAVYRTKQGKRRAARGDSTAVIANQGWEWLQGIADPVRFSLMQELSRVEEATATELEDRCEVSRATLRRHLNALVAIGLVSECVGASGDGRTGRPPTRFQLAATVRDRTTVVFGS